MSFEHVVYACQVVIVELPLQSDPCVNLLLHSLGNKWMSLTSVFGGVHNA